MERAQSCCTATLTPSILLSTNSTRWQRALNLIPIRSWGARVSRMVLRTRLTSLVLPCMSIPIPSSWPLFSMMFSSAYFGWPKSPDRDFRCGTKRQLCRYHNGVVTHDVVGVVVANRYAIVHVVEYTIVLCQTILDAPAPEQSQSILLQAAIVDVRTL